MAKKRAAAKSAGKPTPALMPGLEKFQSAGRADWWKRFQQRDPEFAKQFVATIDAFLDGKLPQFTTTNELHRWMLANYKSRLQCAKSTLYKFTEERRERRGQSHA